MFAHSRYVPFCKQIARGVSKAVVEMGEQIVEGTVKAAEEIGEVVTEMVVEETTGGMELEGKGLLKNIFIAIIMLQYGINFFGQIYLTLFFTKSYNKRFIFYAAIDGMGAIVEQYHYDYELEQVLGESNLSNLCL